MPPTRKLKVFLCHASEDKPKVQELYLRLKREGIDVWLDKKNLLPGSDWETEIRKAVREADVVVVCLSKGFNQAGFRQKEVQIALDAAMHQPEGEIFIIPARLEECENLESLKKWHWVDLYENKGYQNLVRALKKRANSIGATLRNRRSIKSVAFNKNDESKDNFVEENLKELNLFEEDFDLYKFIEIPKNKKVFYTFHIGKYPVTNAQYERFLTAPDFANPIYWLEFPNFDEECKKIIYDDFISGKTKVGFIWGETKDDFIWKKTKDDWVPEGINWLREELKKSKSKVLLPRFWEDKDFGKINPNHPVVGISWYEANAYCEWLFQNWHTLSESKVNVAIKPQTIRLPLETEWVKAAGGNIPEGRYAWDEKGKETTSLKEILRRANVVENGIGKTTPVDAYPLGKSPYSVMDMSGNVWEWQANYKNMEEEVLGMRGGSWLSREDIARISVRFGALPNFRYFGLGFRVVISVTKSF